MHNHFMPHHRQTVRTRQPGRTGPNYRNTLARRGRSLKGMFALLLQMIGGEALKLSDFHRLTFGGLANAGLFAQLFGRTNASTHAAHDVLAKNGFRSSIRCASCDLPDKQRNIDVCRTGRDAGGIMAEITPVRGDQGLVGV